MKILRITSSPRKAYSQSIKLGAAIVDRLLAVHPDAVVKHRDLSVSPLPHLEERHLHAFYAPVEHRRPDYLEAVRPSDEAIAELVDADVLVIEAPLYNFTIASTLKAWLDHVVRSEVTFRHTPDGDIGLLTAKKVYVAITAGYVYAQGPGRDKDFVTPLLRAALGTMGLTDITFVLAEGFNVPGLKKTALQKALDGLQI